MTAHTLESPMILIVDDDEATTQHIAQILRLQGFHTQTALDAADGLRETKRLHPDAVIVDLRMPSTDGLGFLRRLRASEQGSHIPVAIMTGDVGVDEATIAEARSLGARIAFKPLWFEDLVALAKSLLQ